MVNDKTLLENIINDHGNVFGSNQGSKNATIEASFMKIILKTITRE